MLEGRVDAGMPGWTIELHPPMLPLPAITLIDGQPDEAGKVAMDVIAWAAERRALGVVLAGRGEAFDSVATALRAKGVTLTQTDGGSANRIEVRWQALPQ